MQSLSTYAFLRSEKAVLQFNNIAVAERFHDLKFPILQITRKHTIYYQISGKLRGCGAKLRAKAGEQARTLNRLSCKTFLMATVSPVSTIFASNTVPNEPLPITRSSANLSVFRFCKRTASRSSGGFANADADNAAARAEHAATRDARHQTARTLVGDVEPVDAEPLMLQS